MPVLVRNSHPGPTVFSHKQTDTAIEWKGAGDPSGEDVQQVPDHVLENVDFLRVVNKGILVIEGASSEQRAKMGHLDAATKALAERRKNNYEESQQDDASSAASFIEHTRNNDMVSVPCIGPNSKGKGVCGNDVTVRDLNKDDQPPLCGIHAGLSSQYIVTETEEMGPDGKAIKKWQRMTISGRQTGNQ